MYACCRWNNPAGSSFRKDYNDLVLGIEDDLREEIEQAADPLAKALIMSRIGNYIDFGAFDPYIIKLIIN